MKEIFTIKIQYHFKGDPPKKHYTCNMTQKQYDNFRVIPVVNWCIVMDKTLESHTDNSQSIEDALATVLQKDEERV